MLVHLNQKKSMSEHRERKLCMLAPPKYTDKKYYLDESDGNIYLCARADTEIGKLLFISYLAH